MSETATDVIKVTLKRSGDLTIKEDGIDTVVAHYDRESGHLEFATKAASEKYYNQVVARIGSESGGTQQSSLVIRSMGVKGVARTDPKKLPKKPKLGPLGDSAEEYVRWMLDNDMPQAIIRYGIYTDAKGQPIRRKVRRVVENTVDVRAEVEDGDIEAVKDGPKSTTKAPVNRARELLTFDNAFIARRATALTFAPHEVVGGFQPDDDFEIEGDTDDAEGGE